MMKPQLIDHPKIETETRYLSREQVISDFQIDIKRMTGRRTFPYDSSIHDHREANGGTVLYYDSTTFPHGIEVNGFDVEHRSGQPIESGNSAHNIIFGDLKLRELGSNFRIVPVAVKRYDASSRAMGEWAKTQRIRSMGLPVFKQMFVLTDPERSYTVTKTDPNIIGMDKYNWRGLYDDEGLTIDHLAKIATVLAKFHATRTKHGDAQVKNFVIDPTTGAISLIDFEGCTFAESLSDKSLMEICMRDLKVFYISTSDRFKESMIHLFNGSNQWENYSEYFLLPYAMTLCEESTRLGMGEFDIDDVHTCLDINLRNHFGIQQPIQSFNQ